MRKKIRVVWRGQIFLIGAEKTEWAAYQTGTGIPRSTAGRCLHVRHRILPRAAGRRDRVLGAAVAKREL